MEDEREAASGPGGGLEEHRKVLLQEGLTHLECPLISDMMSTHFYCQHENLDSQPSPGFYFLF